MKVATDKNSKVVYLDPAVHLWNNYSKLSGKSALAETRGDIKRIGFLEEKAMQAACSFEDTPAKTVKGLYLQMQYFHNEMEEHPSDNEFKQRMLKIIIKGAASQLES